MEALIGNGPRRCRLSWHPTAPPDYRFRIYTACQERRVTAEIKRQI
jgi:hypothetical protein